ncbi:PREDICTED: carcinoembryonic antigen-related cell adhesion molecule 5-like isoform X3 [Poecilia mexicana]|uniref:carcinoembryonic antigen-related cell adhesion molecule 5-like isoform X3 n=1 Tax=Poecilia mexicana TaxID=48701 RepID=UPI00072E5FBB|nr:PREDICTED: carcinoembryonic antigen-related cell adhesion molecule 5-like isoform X3 [Poecilia mexicana]
MESPLLFFLILTTITFTDPVHSQIIYPSENPVPLRSNVTIISNTNITLGTWTFDNNLLALIYPEGFYLSKAKRDRFIYDSNTSSLTIISAQLADSGVYKLEEMDKFSVQVQLSVQEPISNVTLSAQRTDLVEFNDTAVFVCSVSTGTSLSYKWLARDSEISTGPGVQLSNGGANLSIVGLTRSDEGPYICNVSNGLGYKVSPPVYLNISYGANNATMTVDPVKYMYRSGSNITLSCSVESKPTAMVQWMFDGVNLNQFGLQLHLQNVKKNNTGTYTCLFHNTVTMRFSSDSTVIRVMDPISAVVMSEANGPAVLDKAFSLQCEATGLVDSIQWWKNGSRITPDNRTTFGNKTLTLNPVQLSDGGLYMCQVFNLVSNLTSDPFAVVVNYGPMKPTVMGPNVVKSGDTATFSCSAESVPPSLYRWHFNGSVVSNMSEYTTPSLTKDMSWEYTCMALNTITGKNSSASTMLAVVDPIQSVEIQAQMNSTMENYSHNLTCNVVGPADYIYWMKSGNLLLADNRTIFDMKNKTVMFLALNSSDSGHYQCVAVNALGNMTSAHYTLHVIYGPEMPTISGPKAVKPGNSSTLSCYAPSYPPSFYRWYFNDTLVSNMSEYMTPPVTEEKSLKYTCMAFNNITAKNSSASITITAIASIKNVQIDTPTSDAMEGHSYNLMCNVTGAVDNIYWMKNGEQIHQDNSTVFSMDNKTVNFMPVDRYDAGDYVCMAVNAVGNLSSSAYLLQVIFGPDEPIIHGPEFGEAGRNAVFNCSAASMPPSTYSWWFNDSLMANTSEFTAGPLSFNMSGTYKCVAHNHVTEKNSTNSTMLTVIEGIDSVMIQNNLTPISNKNFTLTCLVVGPYDALYWMKDGMQLSLNASDPAPSMYITEDNILHFTQLTTQSNGAYQCVATNKAALHTSQQYKLLVHYGPLNMNISGPGSAKDGAVVSLNCTVDSYPACDFYWFLNNKSSLLKIGSVFSFSATIGKEGDYICVATNPVTNVTMTQTKSFAIENHASANHITNKGAVLLMGLCPVLVHLLLL